MYIGLDTQTGEVVYTKKNPTFGDYFNAIILIDSLFNDLAKKNTNFKKRNIKWKKFIELYNKS